MDDPLPPVRFLPAHKAPPRPAHRGKLGVPVIGLNGKESAEFILPEPPATDLMIGISAKSHGTVEIKAGRRVLETLDVADVFAATNGLWAPQTWRRIALPASSAGQTLHIKAGRGSWIGLCPPFVR